MDIHRTRVGWTKNGLTVFMMDNSKHKYYEKGLTLQLLYDTLQKITFDGEHRSVGKFTVAYDHAVGLSPLVETTSEDDVKTAFIHGYSVPRIVVLNKEMTPSNKVSVILKKLGNKLILIDCHLGETTPRFPADKKIKTEDERQKSINFWSTHAVIVDEDDIDTDRTEQYFDGKEEAV